MISACFLSRHVVLTLLLGLVFSSLNQGVLAKTAKGGAQHLLQDSLVEFEVNRKTYDYQTPWSRASGMVRKSGLYVGDQEFLTTADGLADRTSIRMQRNGRGKWWSADVKWIDYHANLAILAPKETEACKGLKAVEFMTRLSPNDELQIHRWRNGNMEVRNAEFNQFEVEDAKLSYVQYVQMELSSEIDGTGWSEPVVSGNKIAGVLTSQNRNILSATPAPFIQRILDARKRNNFKGLGYFDFTWQHSENPALHRALGLPGEARGVVVTEGAKQSGQTNAVRARDILLEIDGFRIDFQGDYQDPIYGHLMLENLSTRNHWAGEEISIKLWRDGKQMEVAYKLPKADYGSRLLPDHLFDEEPEYLVMGGLVFQPLSNAYLRSWGDDWRRRSPFRLFYYNNEMPSKERPALVFLSTVLPDLYNLGYQDMRLLVLDKVNGQKISYLKDLASALKSPRDGYHILEFMKGDSLQRMVLDAGKEEQATRRVLQKYGIDEDRLIRTSSQ